MTHVAVGWVCGGGGEEARRRETKQGEGGMGLPETRGAPPPLSWCCPSNRITGVMNVMWVVVKNKHTRGHEFTVEVLRKYRMALHHALMLMLSPKAAPACHARAQDPWRVQRRQHDAAKRL